jgi:hypothetical protein
MYLKLTPKNTLWIGIGIILFYYFLTKFNFIQGSSQTIGTVAPQLIPGSVLPATIEFKTVTGSYSFYGAPNVKYEDLQALTVIYKTDNPSKAYVYSFLGFWHEGLLLCLIPLALWSAFMLSFFSNEHSFIVSLFGKRKIIAQKKEESENKQLKKT